MPSLTQQRIVPQMDRRFSLMEGQRLPGTGCRCLPARGRYTLPVQSKAGHSRRSGKPGSFEVRVVSPPPASLGIHSLPPETHNGDRICVEGEDYIVCSLSLQYRLVGGRYQREHNRLDVETLGRRLVNRWLSDLYNQPAAPPLPSE